MSKVIEDKAMEDFRIGDFVTWEGAEEGQFEVVLKVDHKKNKLYFKRGYWLDFSDAIYYFPPNKKGDYFEYLITQARERAKKAMIKFPQPNYVLNKLSEEHGEVVKAVVHYTEGRETWENVENELIDNLAMLIRLVSEGDGVMGFELPDYIKNFKEESK